VIANWFRRTKELPSSFKALFTATSVGWQTDTYLSSHNKFTLYGDASLCRSIIRKNVETQAVP